MSRSRMSAVPVQARRPSARFARSGCWRWPGTSGSSSRCAAATSSPSRSPSSDTAPPSSASAATCSAHPHEAEDAVQHTFAAAWRDLEREDDREIALKPWLFTIARNRCLSMLRSRREQYELPELATAGLAEQVERRADLRELLRDIAELPAEQREALLLTEAGGLTHAEVARRARLRGGAREVARIPSAERADRPARCAGHALRAIREQLANRAAPRCGATTCASISRTARAAAPIATRCKRQRELLAAALPVTPAGGLELSVLAAAGIGGGGRRDGRCRRRPRSRGLVARRQARARRRHGGGRGHRREAARGQPGRPAEADTRGGTGRSARPPPAAPSVSADLRPLPRRRRRGHQGPGPRSASGSRRAQAGGVRRRPQPPPRRRASPAAGTARSSVMRSRPCVSRAAGPPLRRAASARRAAGRSRSRQSRAR